MAEPAQASVPHDAVSAAPQGVEVSETQKAVAGEAVSQDKPAEDGAAATQVAQNADVAPELPMAPAAQPVKADAGDAPVRGRGRPRKVEDVQAAPVKARPARKIAAKKVAPVAGKTTPEQKPVINRAAAQTPATHKETIKMATKSKTPEFAAKFQDTFKDAGEKAKAAFEKSQAAFGDAGEFAKGNMEAVVESTKILANGVKSMGEAYVAETRSAYETMTADLKELAGVKSPVEFFELQSKLFRKNFDAAVAAGSKKSEQALKLANEAFQPISTRMSLAMEKIKHAA